MGHDRPLEKSPLRWRTGIETSCATPCRTSSFAPATRRGRPPSWRAFIPGLAHLVHFACPAARAFLARGSRRVLRWTAGTRLLAIKGVPQTAAD